MKSPIDAATRIVANNIRKIREYRNYTQDYLAAKLSISQNAYSKIELGYTNISIGKLLQIAEVLEIDVANLIKSNPEELVQLHTEAVINSANGK